VGPSGQSIDTSFKNRNNARLYEDIGHVLFEIVKHTPNGVVALFPSYSFLEETKNHLTTQKILTKLYAEKSIFFERKDSSDFTTILERYMKDAQSDKGALLFALIRGKVSEGLDFANKKCRAVVLVGVPYPCSKDVKVVAKKEYLDDLSKKGEKSLSGTQWYLAETVRAINQGIGRLIRTPTDFGSVYLLDARFNRQDIEAQLASWARMNLSKPSTYNEFVQKVK
jgi:regulator of telomere elongation helicase 1